MSKSLVWRIRVIFIVLCLAGSICQATTIPQIALGGGYECILFIRNLSGSDWNGLAHLRQLNSRMWKESWSLDGEVQNGGTFDISLAPGETRKYVLSGTTLAVGYLVINGAGGRIPAQGEILVSFFYKFLDQSSALVDSIGVSESLPATDYFFTVEKTDLVDTGYAFVSFNRRNDFKIYMTLYNQRGEPAGGHEFRYSGHRSQFFSEFFSIDPDFIGSVSLRSEELINLTVIRLESQTSGFQLTNVPPTSILRLSSPDIRMGQPIPDEFSCKESDKAPALLWNRLPVEVASWALVLEDPDASEDPFIHWIMFDIPGTVTFLQQDEVPSGAKLANNDFGEQDYGGPCAPAGPLHRYFFKLYALDVATLNLDNPNIEELLNAMENHIISSAQLMGIWTR